MIFRRGRTAVLQTGSIFIVVMERPVLSGTRNSIVRSAWNRWTLKLWRQIADRLSGPPMVVCGRNMMWMPLGCAVPTCACCRFGACAAAYHSTSLTIGVRRRVTSERRKAVIRLTRLGLLAEKGQWSQEKPNDDAPRQVRG